MDKQTFIREALSKEYPRLDIRCGASYAKPWQKPQTKILFRAPGGEWKPL